MHASVTSELFKAAMASFAAGVTIVTTADAHGQPFGLTATAFSSVSKDPPLCLVCVGRDAEAYPVLHAARRFAVNVLSRDQEALAMRFATHGLDKFDGTHWTPGAVTGSPVLAGTLASIECDVSSIAPAGDHDVFLGAIRHIVLGSGAPLVYFRGRFGDVT